MNVALDHSEPIAENIRVFWFKPEKPVRYIAGQFIQLHIPHKNADERGAKRWFTLSSSPTDPMLSITTKFAEKGSSFKQALRALQPGARLHMAEPMGDFVLPKDATIPLVFAAGGIGVTPFHSMIKYLEDMDKQRDILLIHAANKASELAYRDLFEQAKIRYIPIIKEADTAWQGESGALSAERIRNLAGSTDSRLVYLSGPEPMIEAFAKDLRASGLNRQQIVTDFFPGYTQF